MERLCRHDGRPSTTVGCRSETGLCTGRPPLRKEDETGGIGSGATLLQISINTNWFKVLLGPFHGAIAVPSVTRCRCRRRRRRGHRCAGGVRQWRQWRHLVNDNVKRLAAANGPNIFQMLLVL